jgi:hypothetical protein
MPLGSAASLAANVPAAQPAATGRVIAAGSIEQVTAGPAAHQVVWLSAAEVGKHPGVVEDTRLLAKEVLARIDDLVGSQQGLRGGSGRAGVASQRVVTGLREGGDLA